MAENKKYTPLLPYDGTIGQYFSTYDTMTYVCNRDLCHPNIRMNTENIVKYYTYIVSDEPTLIGSGEE